MSKSKPIHRAIHQLFCSRSLLNGASGGSQGERFSDGGGWAVSINRGLRTRAADPHNLAKRDAAVADLKRTCKANKLFAWGVYENQRSKINYAHDDADCAHFGKVFQASAAKLARGQLACGCNRRAAASERALDLPVIRALAEARGGTLLSEHYLNNRTKLRWQCADGHQFLMPYDDAAAGR